MELRDVSRRRCLFISGGLPRRGGESVARRQGGKSGLRPAFAPLPPPSTHCPRARLPTRCALSSPAPHPWLPLTQAACAVLASAYLSQASPPAAHAISGGGLDYAGQQLSGMDMSDGKYAGMDFSGSRCRGTNFRGADLSRVRFFKADLAEADLTDANLTGASLEQAVLRDAILHDALLQSTYWTETVLEVKDIENSDWTDALLQPFVQSRLCKRADAKGTNTRTGADTRASLMCPDE